MEWFLDDAHGLVKTIFAEFSTDRGGFESPQMDIKTVDFKITLQKKGIFQNILSSVNLVTIMRDKCLLKDFIFIPYQLNQCAFIYSVTVLENSREINNESGL